MELQVKCFQEDIFKLCIPLSQKKLNAHDVVKDFNPEVPNCSPRAMHINE